MSAQELEQARREFEALPGLKRRDITHCALCGEGVMHGGGLLFYRVAVEVYMVNIRAIERQHGFEMFMGNPAIAQAMGPDEDLAKQVPGTAKTVLICSLCSMKPHALMMIGERDGDEEAGDRSRHWDGGDGVRQAHPTQTSSTAGAATGAVE